ncbi:MAG: 4-(cytidine 5'-diphospho)-2-C-methyl-D-erythritol kinase [Croceibacterium sp.]
MSKAVPAVLAEPAPAKLNLALHVRGRRPDGRHDIETIFAFCIDGDRVEATEAEGLSLVLDGPFADDLPDGADNLIIRAAHALAAAADVPANAALRLVKNLPVASGIGGGSANAAATLRLLTRLWDLDPKHAEQVAPVLGSDVPACLLSMSARGEGAGDKLLLLDAGVAGTPVLLVNPLRPLSTAAVFARWDGTDRGPLGNWREGRNDLQPPATGLVPEIADILQCLHNLEGRSYCRMSGSGPTCFALFENDAARDAAAAQLPADWWHLATWLR